MSLDSNVQVMDAQGDPFLPVSTKTKTILIPMDKKSTAPNSTVTSQDIQHSTIITRAQPVSAAKCVDTSFIRV